MPLYKQEHCGEEPCEFVTGHGMHGYYKYYIRHSFNPHRAGSKSQEAVRLKEQSVSAQEGRG